MISSLGRSDGELLSPTGRYAFPDLTVALGAELDRFPYVHRILIENVLRHDSDPQVAIAAFRAWLDAGTSTAEISFRPTRILMHDTTCVPALVDIAGMRDAVAEAGGDPARLSP